MKTSIKAINKSDKIKIKARGKVIEQLDIITVFICHLIKKFGLTKDDIFSYIKIHLGILENEDNDEI